MISGRVGSRNNSHFGEGLLIINFVLLLKALSRMQALHHSNDPSTFTSTKIRSISTNQVEKNGGEARCSFCGKMGHILNIPMLNGLNFTNRKKRGTFINLSLPKLRHCNDGTQTR